MDEYLCEMCNYRTKRRSNYDKHLISAKHLSMTAKLMNGEVLVSKELCCELCDYKTNKRGNFQKHIKTQKHQRNVKKQKIINDNNNNNICQKEEDKELEQLSKNDLLEIIKEMIPKVNSTNNINNSSTINNNTVNNTNNINIQVFLDDKCKDAMTIQNFITQMTLSIEDLLEHKTNGVSSGISNVIIKNLRPIPITERPIHLTDDKKKKWMINDEFSGWTEEDGKKVMNKAGEGINNKFQTLWETAYPNWKKDEDLKDIWLELVRCLNTEFSEKEVMTTLKKIGSECKLTIDDIKAIYE